MHSQLAIRCSLGVCSPIMPVASIAVRCTTMSIVFLTKLNGVVYFFRSCLQKLSKVLLSQDRPFDSDPQGAEAHPDTLQTIKGGHLLVLGSSPCRCCGIV